MNNSSQQYSFVSYSRINVKFVNSLREVFETKQEPVWFDLLTPSGFNWKKTIIDKLEKCKALIAVISEAYGASAYCRDELVYARSLGIHLFPVLYGIAPNNKVVSELELSDIQCYQLHMKDDGSVDFQAMLDAFQSSYQEFVQQSNPPKSRPNKVLLSNMFAEVIKKGHQYPMQVTDAMDRDFIKLQLNATLWQALEVMREGDKANHTKPIPNAFVYNGEVAMGWITKGRLTDKLPPDWKFVQDVLGKDNPFTHDAYNVIENRFRSLPIAQDTEKLMLSLYHEQTHAIDPDQQVAEVIEKEFLEPIILPHAHEEYVYLRCLPVLKNNKPVGILGFWNIVNKCINDGLIPVDPIEYIMFDFRSKENEASVPIVDANMTLAEVDQHVKAKAWTHVIVKDDTKTIKVLRAEQVKNLMHPDFDLLAQKPIGAFMKVGSVNLRSLEEGLSVKDVINIFQTHTPSSIVVVNSNQEPIGILRHIDILRVLRDMMNSR